jgi:hypothetical protein
VIRAQDHKTKIAYQSQAYDWLKWQPVTISANQMLHILDWSPDLVL